MSSDNYLDELNKYFVLKNKYYEKINREKNKILKNSELTSKEKQLQFSKLQFKCINCNNLGGTIFETKNNVFKVYCGNSSKPCDLNISIQRKQKHLINEKILEYVKIIDNLKQEIILTKLNYIFNFITEEKSIELFNKIKESITSNTNIYNDLYIKYVNITTNLQKKDEINNALINHKSTIDDINRRIELYKKTNSITYINEVIEIYINDLQSLTDKLKKLQYKNYHVETKEISETTSKKLLLNVLVKNIYNIKDLEIDKR